MSDGSLLLNFVLLVLILLVLQRQPLPVWFTPMRATWRERRPRHWKPQSPHDCPQCRSKLDVQLLRSGAAVRPYAACKSRRGRRKTVPTGGFACPNAACAYCGITDDEGHALVGYGKDNGIQRLKCQAGGKVVTSRLGTPLYYLKADFKQVELVLWFLAEGVAISVLVRYTGRADATVARWLERMGCHSQDWHTLLFRHLVLPLIQMDELYTRLRAPSSAGWVWLAFDPLSKAIPALHVGGRTQADAFALVHDLKQRLALECIPSFTTDGLRSYFYALCPFGHLVSSTACPSRPLATQS